MVVKRVAAPLKSTRLAYSKLNGVKSFRVYRSQQERIWWGDVWSYHKCLLGVDKCDLEGKNIRDLGQKK